MTAPPERRYVFLSDDQPHAGLRPHDSDLTVCVKITVSVGTVDADVLPRTSDQGR